MTASVPSPVSTPRSFSSPARGPKQAKQSGRVERLSRVDNRPTISIMLCRNCNKFKQPSPITKLLGSYPRYTVVRTPQPKNQQSPREPTAPIQLLPWGASLAASSSIAAVMQRRSFQTQCRDHGVPQRGSTLGDLIGSLSYLLAQAELALAIKPDCSPELVNLPSK